MHRMGSSNKPRGLSSLTPAAAIVGLVLALALAVPAGGSQAAGLSAIAPGLGDATTFSVLAHLSMDSANMTTVSGDLGLSSGLAAQRTGPWTVGGSQYFGPSSLAFNARADALAAFNNLAGQGPDGSMITVSPWSPVPGVYNVASDITFAGTITLNGDYGDVWVFQVGRDMTFTGSVVMTGNAQPCDVFWQIGRDATIGVGSTFVGTLIASRDITVVSGATVNGRIISLNSSLTTDANTISGPTCAGPRPTPTPTPPGPPGPPAGFVPEPGSVMLLGSGLVGLALFGFAQRRKRGTS